MPDTKRRDLITLLLPVYQNNGPIAGRVADMILREQLLGFGQQHIRDFMHNNLSIPVPVVDAACHTVLYPTIILC